MALRCLAGGACHYKEPFIASDDAAGHSAAFFGEQRDYWWNRDFLDLVVARLGLGTARSVLDVGCGLGHWSRELARVLPGVTEITGVDPDPFWVRQARLTTDEKASIGTAVIQGRGEDLPFPDSQFDLVTCQTVLIHVPDVVSVLREMGRVVRPGGTVLLAEPNNLAGHLVRTRGPEQSDARALTSALAFYSTCEAGKIALGEGDNSVGDLLPGLVAEAGLAVAACYLSDKASPLWPPYSSPEQSALVEALEASVKAERCPWSREETRRYFLAGGGEDGEFREAWAERLGEIRADLAALHSGRLSTGGGQLMYLIAATKSEGT
ncbi:MAG: methyltransferase domain-containing protein [Candidatus Dormiibacterota bacterium]